ncbi:MAG: hypothetical protein L0Y44_08365 [Phycisphaerales bacterium]|nr:hypothetical protein [Phycisphaerales bacterium]
MKRPLATVAVFIVLGAIVNVAVAWGCVRACYPTSIQTETEFRRFLGTEIKHRIARDAVAPMRLDQLGWQPRDNTECDEFQVISTHRLRFGCEFVHCAEHWGCAPGKIVFYYPSYPETVSIMNSVTAGWPMACVHGEEWDRKDAPADRRWVFALPHRMEFLGTAWHSHFLLPVKPLWPGFALNTLFYATILWLLFTAPGTIRRWSRNKRNLCPACAYPVGSNPVCTECGNRVPSHTDRG